MKTRYELQAFGRCFSLGFDVEPTKETIAGGMGNRCKDGTYLLFIDYDHTPIDFITEEVKLLQEVYHGVLGNAYLFRTKHGVHVVFLEKHRLGTVCAMLDATSCDKEYRNVPMKYARRIWVLRQTPKKNETLSYLGVIKQDCATEKSLAHKLWIQSHYKIPTRDFPKAPYDGEREIILGYYKIHDQEN